MGGTSPRARMERGVARGAIERDPGFDPVEDEGVAFGLRDADV
jgi:hypothetical protein